MEGIMKFIKNVAIDADDNPITFENAKILLNRGLQFGITTQLLESIAKSEMKDFLQRGFDSQGSSDNDENALQSADDNNILLKSPSSAAAKSFNGNHDTNYSDEDNSSNTRNIIGNAIKNNWPPAFLLSYLKPNPSTTKHVAKKKNEQNKNDKVQTPSSVFRSGSIFSNNNVHKDKKGRILKGVTRVSTPL